MNPDKFLHEYRIKTKIDRPDLKQYKDYFHFPTSAISDAMRTRNTLSHDIKPVLQGEHHIVGTAITVNSSVGDEILVHKAIEIAKPGDIIVVAGNANPYTAFWGGIMSTMAKVRDVRGLITDGMIRDLSEIRELDFPVWATGVTPIAPNTDVPPGDLNLPISIGEVIIHPGDLVVADEDGVVIVPQSMIGDVSKAVKERLKMEEEWVEEINSTKKLIFKEPLDKLLEKRAVRYLD